MPTSRTCRPRKAFSLVELMLVLGILFTLFLEWHPDYSGVQDDGRRSAMQIEVRTLEHACEAFLRSRGRYPSSITELCDAGILDRRPDPYRERETGQAIFLVPSAPGRLDLAGARIVPTADWESAVPAGGWGWN